MIFSFVDGRNRDHRDCDLLMVSQIVLELKIKIRLLITRFLVFTENIVSNDKAV